MNNDMEKAKRRYQGARHIAEGALINEARRFLCTLPEGAECVCAMGSLSFSTDDDEFDIPFGSEMEKIISEFEEMFGPTYGPWRFTRDGDVRNDW